MAWNFAIIGCGNISHTHAEAIQSITNANLLAIYSRDIQKANKFASSYACQAYDNLEALLSNEDLDIVAIATPSGAHLEPALKAAEAKKHVIVEKPLEISIDRINQMISACKDNNVKLSGIFNRRFNPAVRKLKQAIELGRFGQVSMVDAQIKWYRDQAYYDSGAWRGTKLLDGGGALMNQGIHTIDQLLYFAGDVKRLSATTALLTHQNIEVEDCAVAILEFENGARGVIQGSTSCWSTNGHPAEIHICGDQGSVFLSDASFRIWDFKNPHEMDDDIEQYMLQEGQAGLGANDPTAITIQGHINNFEDFISAIESDSEPEISGIESSKSVALINAIYESASKKGEWVTPEQ